jgi:hypothetical protein
MPTLHHGPPKADARGAAFAHASSALLLLLAGMASPGPTRHAGMACSSSSGFSDTARPSCHQPLVSGKLAEQARQGWLAARHARSTGRLQCTVSCGEWRKGTRCCHSRALDWMNFTCSLLSGQAKMQFLSHTTSMEARKPGFPAAGMAHGKDWKKRLHNKPDLGQKAIEEEK